MFDFKVRIIQNTRIKLSLLSLILVLISLHGFSQNWENYYPTNTYSIYGNAILQTYDGGYVIAVNNDGGKRAKLNKLDVDGNLLWTKEIFCASGYEQVFDLCETPEGGIFVVGRSTCYDSAYASFIMKLNSCGELVWLKEYGAFGDFDYMYRIMPLRDGNYLVGGRYLGIGNSNRVNLIKFDILGNTIWEGDFTHHNSPSLENIMENSDSTIFITGITYLPNLGQVNPARIRSHLIKVNKNGNEIWEYVVGLGDTIMTNAANSIFLNDSTILMLSYFQHPLLTLKRWNYIINIDTSGQEIWKKFVSDTNSLSEHPFELIKISDSTALILCNVSYSYNFNTINDYRLKAIKIDFAGNVLDSIQFGSGFNEGIRAIKNRDGDVVICGIHFVGNQSGAFAIKIRPDLQIDTLFNQSLTYDSLCLFPILTDTIIYDTTFVSLNEHNSRILKTHIFPNPTSGEVTVEYDPLAFTEGGLEIYSAFGMLVKKVPLNINERKISFSMETFPSGVYVVKVVGNGQYFDAIKLCLISK